MKQINFIFVLALVSSMSLFAQSPVGVNEKKAIVNYTLEKSLENETIKKLLRSNFDYYISRMRSDIDGDYYRLCFYKMDMVSALSAWEHAVLQLAILKTSQSLKDAEMYNSLTVWTDKTKWGLATKDTWIGNNHLAGEVYLGLSELDKSKANIEIIKTELNRTFTSSWSGKEGWSWCDALFMSPPAYALMSRVTGDRKYIDFMDEKFKLCYNQLYDKEEKFFFRDEKFIYSPNNPATIAQNGKKIFWGRGNGWVIGGIVRVLEYMPKDYPSRGFYVTLFKEMAGAFAKSQLKTGLWSASLLDPNSFPAKETTGSSLACYALAWGINNKILDEKVYRPIVNKAWLGLANCMLPIGAIGSVQPIGHDPRGVDANYTNDFGIGLFMLAGTEMLNLSK